MNERIVIPMNETGKRIFDLMQTIAENITKRANASVKAYIQAEMPTAHILYGEHRGEKYYVRVRVPHHKTQTLTYDYKTREVSRCEEVMI